ncbi:MAG TPA: DUF3667 domain-containing protein [Chitinophagaceae bacterium]|nr:DUF3667 domain-containing protein [Chitinophagaceae bacterium]
MSHRPERKEKNCLNCGTTVHGKYCHVCGQENVEPKETFWGMVTHFFNDITHFDGKFFTTLKDLLFKPGFLSAEYMKGRRMSYLNPVRMYVFTSAIFFLIFFSVTDPGDTFKLVDDGTLSLAGRDSILQDIQDKLEKDQGNLNLQKQVALLKDTSRPLSELDLLPYSTVVSTLGYDYKSREEYDSVQKARPPDARDSWLKGLWNKRAIRINEKYRQEKSLSLTNFSDRLLHKLPYLLFVSLPFFALILKLLYIRKRKEYYFADHGIFSVHHYILSFILLLFLFLWDKMDDMSGWGIWGVLTGITIVAWPIYLFLAMKRFYRQNGFKTFLKFVLLNISGFIILLLLFVCFFIFSVFQL